MLNINKIVLAFVIIILISLILNHADTMLIMYYVVMTFLQSSLCQQFIKVI